MAPGGRLLGRSAPALGDHGHRPGEDHRAHPVVDAQAEDAVGRVDPQQLDPEAAEGVGGHIDREEAPGAQPGPALDGEDDGHDDQVPEGLVEERGMERLLAGEPPGPVVGVDTQSPRKRRRPPEQLLVEPGAPAAEGLGQGDGRGGGVEKGRGVHAPPPGDPHPDDGTAGHPPPDAQPAVPDAQSAEGVVGVELVVGDHVVEAGADQAGGDGPHRQVADLLGIAPPGRPSAAGHPDGDQDAEQDAQGVRP